ncbi:MAG: hypothetical protein KDE27_25890 [Planctomycetes bacterium]|nr:hypothetical protein [Planctomycetota bacterium]
MRIVVPAAVLSLTAAAVAQVPTPSVSPRVAPRAEYVLTTGVTGIVPANRHWSQATGNDTSLFVFGGRTGTAGTGSKRNDLYEFDATTSVWTEHNLDGDPNAPPQRYRNGLAWDPIGNRLLMFGGEDAAAALLADTWEWIPATNTWNNITPASSPVARRFHSMSYDPASSGILMFGGDDGTNMLGDTWLLVANTWVQLAPTTAPAARSHHSLVTRGDFGDVFLCAGHDNAATNRVHFLDSWRWDGAATTWVQIVPTTAAVPASMAGNQAVYDAERQVVVMTGGQGISTSTAQTGGAYGSAYGGSPSGWTSEFDCVTNEWRLYGGATFDTADPVIGRASRYYSAFVPATSRIYFWGGQDPTGQGASLVAMKEYQASPLASASSFGAGCNSSVGPLGLASDNNPWTGRTWSLTGSGFANGSLAFGVVGFGTQSTPLSAFHPAGGAGCNLLVTNDAVLLLLPVAGQATLGVTLPNNAGLAGLVLDSQMLTIELAGPNISLIASTNAVTGTLGAN